MAAPLAESCDKESLRELTLGTRYSAQNYPLRVILGLARRAPPCPREGLSLPISDVSACEENLLSTRHADAGQCSERRLSCPEISPPSRRMPSHPSFEQLRKQAKDLLERYRAQDPAAIAEVERFERELDPESFALHDAQRVLARSYGYESWPRLKALVDGVNVRELADSVAAGDMNKVRTLLTARPELVGTDLAANNEHRALHFAVLGRNPAMVKLLMEAGADARKGIFPHRDATSALAIARDRGYEEIAAVIEEEERLRREEMSLPKRDDLTGAGPSQRGDHSRK